LDCDEITSDFAGFETGLETRFYAQSVNNILQGMTNALFYFLFVFVFFWQQQQQWKWLD